MKEILPSLTQAQDVFIQNKALILKQWVSYSDPKNILELHMIDEKYFIDNYAGGVFDYFLGVIAGKVEIGNCPVMQELMVYLKHREISAEELFEICSHFRRSMVDFSYDAKINSKDLYDEISYLFDKNFKGILKYYTDTIFQNLIDARQDALKASQAKEYFLSNMSHEIRTPLNAILGFVNLLIDEDISKKHRNYLDIILSSGENLLSIINDILDFSKLRSGEFTIDPKVFFLHEELSHTMELFVAQANSKDITITSFIDPLIPIELHGDALRIKQILSNFLSNAIKFTPESGVIKIEANYDNGILEISVTDSGIGISNKDIEKIFTAFVQAQYSVHKNSDGTGLGLSICHQLAELMKGSVSVTSVVGEGSRFVMQVPIAVHTKKFQVFEDIEEYQRLKMHIYAKDKELTYKHDSFITYAQIFQMDIEVVDNFDGDFDVGIFVHENISNEIIKKMLSSDKKYVALMSREYDDYDTNKHINRMSFPLYCSKIHHVFYELLHPVKHSEYERVVAQRFKGHILVAEDNEANQELIQIILKKYGLTFDLAQNGLVALELYKLNKYDLILMDEQMPVMNGNESVMRIIDYEERNGLSHTPISALTANVIKGAKERDLLSGFDAFLGKPIILKELEKVFVSYLKFDTSVVVREEISKIHQNEIQGLDPEKLRKELMLSDDELIMLLKLFISKMKIIMPELRNAIKVKDFHAIALKAHSIKGSSGNFRIKSLQDNSSEMEQMAKVEDSKYEYEEVYEQMLETIQKIKIV